MRGSVWMVQILSNYNFTRPPEKGSEPSTRCRAWDSILCHALAERTWKNHTLPRMGLRANFARAC